MANKLAKIIADVNALPASEQRKNDARQFLFKWLDYLPDSTIEAESIMQGIDLKWQNGKHSLAVSFGTLVGPGEMYIQKIADNELLEETASKLRLSDVAAITTMVEWLKGSPID